MKMPTPEEEAKLRNPVARVYADFTGLYAREDTERLELLAMCDERDRLNQSFDDTIEIGKAFANLSSDGFGLTLASLGWKGAPNAIGLSGFAQTGKTAAANYIESEYGFRRQHIAEPLREMLRVLLRRSKMDENLIDRYLTGDLKEEVIPALGVTSRHAQITLGTEWGRKLIHPDLWAKTWAIEAEGRGKVMNDSVRFPNEQEAIRDELRGFTIMIERPGTKPAAFKWGWLGRNLYTYFGLLWGAHDSERVDRLDADWTIVNDGTLDDLYREIDRVMRIEGASTKPTA